MSLKSCELWHFHLFMWKTSCQTKWIYIVDDYKEPKVYISEFCHLQILNISAKIDIFYFKHAALKSM